MKVIREYGNDESACVAAILCILRAGQVTGEKPASGPVRQVPADATKESPATGGQRDRG